MNILAACAGADSPVRKLDLQVLGPLLRLLAGRPRLLHRADAPPASTARPRSSATSSRPRRRSPTTPASTPRRRSRSCASPTCSAPTSTPRTRGCSICRPCRWCSASIRGTSSCTRTTSSAPSPTRVDNDLHGIFNVAADGVLALSEVISLLGKSPAPVLSPLRDRPVGGAAARARGPDPARDAGPDALRPRPRQPAAEVARLRLRLHDAGDRAAARRLPAPASGAAAATRAATATSARSRTSCAAARWSSRDGG